MIQQLLAARDASSQAIVTAIGGFVQVGRDSQDVDHDPDGRYLYRGHAIVGEPSGWSVWDPRRASSDEELGWGCDLASAMDVVDEIVEDEIAN